jgi:hypothetical protein
MPKKKQFTQQLKPFEMAPISLAEQAASYIFPANLSEEELQAAHLEIKVFRMQRLQAMTDQQRLHAELLRLKFQMEDY